MSGTNVHARRRALAAVMVALLTAGACSTPSEPSCSRAKCATVADSRHRSPDQRGR